MLAIMGNALQPTQRLFMITIVEPEYKIFLSSSYRGWVKSTPFSWGDLPVVYRIKQYRSSLRKLRLPPVDTECLRGGITYQYL